MITHRVCTNIKPDVRHPLCVRCSKTVDVDVDVDVDKWRGDIGSRRTWCLQLVLQQCLAIKGS